MKDWQLLRCLYDYMGMSYIEIVEPIKFAEQVKKEGEANIGWILGTVIPYDNQPNNVIVRVELEGSKDNLEAVLELIQNN